MVVVASGFSMMVFVKVASCLRFCSSLCRFCSSSRLCEEAFNFPSWDGGLCLDYRAWAFCGTITRVKKYLVMIRLLLFSFYSSTRRKQHDMTWKECSVLLLWWLPAFSSIQSPVELYSVHIWGGLVNGRSIDGVWTWTNLRVERITNRYKLFNEQNFHTDSKWMDLDIEMI